MRNRGKIVYTPPFADSTYGITLGVLHWGYAFVVVDSREDGHSKNVV